jgi:hypothetical protein
MPTRIISSAARPPRVATGPLPLAPGSEVAALMDSVIEQVRLLFFDETDLALFLQHHQFTA